MEEQVINQDQQPETQDNMSAVDIINDMRANTVSKDKYNKLESEHNKLLKALAKGEEVEVDAPEKPDIDKLRKELYTDEVEKLNDLQMVEKTLQLRQAIIDEGGLDPFVPQGKRTAPEESDFATAERVASVLQQCVDYAEGDNSVFVNELQRRTMDVSPIPAKKRHR